MTALQIDRETLENHKRTVFAAAILLYPMPLKPILMKLFRISVVLGLLAVQGCTTKAEFVSQQTVEDKVSRLTLGQTTMPEVEAIFGVAQLKDSRFWAYNM